MCQAGTKGQSLPFPSSSPWEAHSCLPRAGVSMGWEGSHGAGTRSAPFCKETKLCPAHSSTAGLPNSLTFRGRGRGWGWVRRGGSSIQKRSAGASEPIAVGSEAIKAAWRLKKNAKPLQNLPPGTHTASLRLGRTLARDVRDWRSL